MTFEKWADARTRKLSVWDLALVKASCVAAGLLISRLLPASQRIDSRLLAAVAIGLAVKPAITFLSPKTSS